MTVGPTIGQRFNRWTVLKIETRKTCLCRCDCGTERVVHTYDLKTGKSKSCRCFQSEASSKRATTHGLSKTPEYRNWAAMIQRCTNPNIEKYPSYGGRGIAVCRKWRRFEAFLADMGCRPSKTHSIDRIDNDGNYEPKNCRWATPTEQARNKRNTSARRQGNALS